MLDPLILCILEGESLFKILLHLLHLLCKLLILDFHHLVPFLKSLGLQLLYLQELDTIFELELTDWLAFDHSFLPLI